MLAALRAPSYTTVQKGEREGAAFYFMTDDWETVTTWDATYKGVVRAKNTIIYTFYVHYTTCIMCTFKIH